MNYMRSTSVIAPMLDQCRDCPVRYPNGRLECPGCGSSKVHLYEPGKPRITANLMKRTPENDNWWMDKKSTQQWFVSSGSALNYVDMSPGNITVSSGATTRETQAIDNNQISSYGSGVIGETVAVQNTLNESYQRILRDYTA